MHFGFTISPETDILYDTVEIWLMAIGAAWGAFKSYQWVKAIREKDLRGIKLNVDTLHTATIEQTEKIELGFSNLQTATVRELQELRSDFRAFYTSPNPVMVPVRARTMRKKPGATVRPKKKKKPAAKRKAK